MKDAKIKKLIEDRIKPSFDRFNAACANVSLDLSNLYFELDVDKRRKAKKITDDAINTAKEST